MPISSLQSLPKYATITWKLRIGAEDGVNSKINKELLDAVIGNHFHTVKRLLENGADPNYFEDEAQIRPLHFAALYNSPDVVPLLIMTGADLNATTEYDDTPLMIAKRHEHQEVLQALQRFCGVKVNHETQQ
ncbi:ankyrin repeat domain-containing protein [Coxiella endosymbiont of Ornithodoros amblus]|uniref:ankyrin repeat domain-containing protein n=1 Tax=Coxiella endosymbiont of Ornithodoros amblus TaxID=1656166 RepID=UPI00244DEE20|nr:ankyrin repeat domain-containing protein [Coxiella endosymbiont of Ornithodoros amblus]MBW5802352.1 ankyrin repeat domain-containing protein [Coxiella endosymbiont of Ornithodoros amblus]